MTFLDLMKALKVQTAASIMMMSPRNINIYGRFRLRRLRAGLYSRLRLLSVKLMRHGRMIYRPVRLGLGLGGLRCGQISRILRVEMFGFVINNFAVRLHINLADVVAVRRCRVGDVNFSSQARCDQGGLSFHRRTLNGDAARRAQHSSLRDRLVVRLHDGSRRWCRLRDGRRRCWQTRWADVALRYHGELMDGRFNNAAIVTAGDVLADDDHSQRPQADFLRHFRRICRR